MNAVKVQYTVQPDYVETNKANINRVINDLKALASPDIKYSAFLLDDGQTFVHIVFRTSAEAGRILTDLPAFQDFRQQLRTSQPVSPPKAENLNLVGTAWNIF